VTTSASPTVNPPRQEGLNRALTRNIGAMQARRKEEDARASFQDRFAQAITAFTGSMIFVYVHLAILVFWIGANSGLISSLTRFDPSFVILATATSVEAIFLSTFVLISQNRASAAADSRAALDLQINLLAEHEVTRLVALTKAIAKSLNIPEALDPELDELERDVAPEAVLDTLERDSGMKGGSRPG
jgi:uncharacterized membrane protein